MMSIGCKSASLTGSLAVIALCASLSSHCLAQVRAGNGSCGTLPVFQFPEAVTGAASDSPAGSGAVGRGNGNGNGNVGNNNGNGNSGNFNGNGNVGDGHGNSNSGDFNGNGRMGNASSNGSPFSMLGEGGFIAGLSSECFDVALPSIPGR